MMTPRITNFTKQLSENYQSHSTAIELIVVTVIFNLRVARTWVPPNHIDCVPIPTRDTVPSKLKRASDDGNRTRQTHHQKHTRFRRHS
jgi:hypothetical protein